MYYFKNFPLDYFITHKLNSSVSFKTFKTFFSWFTNFWQFFSVGREEKNKNNKEGQFFLSRIVT